jgi:hypothetical protein
MKKVLYVDSNGDYTEVAGNGVFEVSEHINAFTGTAGQPIITNASGYVDSSLINFGTIDHGSLGGLADDDHTQYVLANGTRAITGQQALNAGARLNSSVTPFEFNQGGVINPTTSGYSSIRPDDYGQFNVVGYDGTNNQKEIIAQKAINFIKINVIDYWMNFLKL